VARVAEKHGETGAIAAGTDHRDVFTAHVAGHRITLDRPPRGRSSRDRIAPAPSAGQISGSGYRPRQRTARADVHGRGSVCRWRHAAGSPQTLTAAAHEAALTSTAPGSCRSARYL